MARQDLICVVHTHTAAGIAVSAQKDGLLPLSQHACKFYNRIAYHGYEGIALDLDERERLVRPGRAQGDDPAQSRPAGRGHLDPRGVPHDLYVGAGVCGPGRCARRRQQIILPPPEVCQHTSDQFKRHEHDEHYAMVWNAALALIEDGKPDYRS